MNWCWLPSGARDTTHPDVISLHTPVESDEVLCGAFDEAGLPLDPYRDVTFDDRALAAGRAVVTALCSRRRAQVGAERLGLATADAATPWQAEALKRMLAEDELHRALSELEALFELAMGEGGRVLMLGD